MDNTIGNNLRTLRKRKGLTQGEVADMMHISQSAYARMENGQTSSWGAYIQRLCTLFEVSPKELFVKNGESLKRQEEIDGLHNTSLLLAHKLIEQYEEWLQEKDEIIALLKNRK